MPAGKPADRTTKWLIAAGLLAPPLDVLVTAWLGALDPQYSHVRNVISELGEEGRPYAGVFAAWCVLFGLLLAGFAAAVRRALRRDSRSRAAAGALLVIGVCSILSGVFPCDPGCAGRTFSAKVHYGVGYVATLAIIAAPLLARSAVRGDPAWRGYGAFSLAAAALLAVITGWLAVCHFGRLDRSACALGAVQRLLLAIHYVWLEALAIRLWTLPRE